MLRFKVIVVPIDFSDHSLRAVPYAASLAQKFGSQLKLLYVNEPILSASDIAWVGVDQRALNADHVSESRQQLERVARDVVPVDVDATIDIVNGRAVDRIVEFSEEAGADLIVMATHGRGGLSHLLMGSTAEAVVRKAHCAVLTLKQPMDVSVPREGTHRA